MPQHQQQRRGPPLAGRPPFATDEDDSVYTEVPAARPRQPRQQQKRNTERDSMYSAWDNYLHDEKDRPQSGAGGIGMGLMALDDSDEDEDPQPKRIAQKTQAPASLPTKSSRQQPANGNRRAPKNNTPDNRDVSEKHRQAPKATPPMSNANTHQPLTRPNPVPAVIPSVPSPRTNVVARTPPPMQHPMPRQAPGVQRPAAATLRVDVMPRAPVPAFMQAPNQASPPSPSLNPHPLNAPSTPITPVFARPAGPSEGKVKFADNAILRGNSEETLLPRNTAKGAEFWHRFSVVANEGVRTRSTKSSWLKRYEGGQSRMSAWVWCISIFILLAIGGAIGFGWYMTHNKAAALPLAVGGSANEAATLTPTTGLPTTEAEPSNTSRSLIAPPAIETRRSLPESFPMPRRNTPSDEPLKRSPHASHLRRQKNRISNMDTLN